MFPPAPPSPSAAPRPLRAAIGPAGATPAPAIGCRGRRAAASAAPGARGLRGAGAAGPPHRGIPWGWTAGGTSSGKGDRTAGRAAQRGGRVTVPGDVQRRSARGTRCPAVLGHGLDSVSLQRFSNRADSGVPQRRRCCRAGQGDRQGKSLVANRMERARKIPAGKEAAAGGVSAPPLPPHAAG